MNHESILKEIQEQQIVPLYFLYGDEGYFLDKVAQRLDEDGVVVQAHERDFNREVFIGPETTAGAILNACQSFPVMAQRRLVILKEAHRMNRNEWEHLIPYFHQPVPSTVLVILYKDRKLPFGKKGKEGFQNHGRMLESRRMYDRDMIKWVHNALATSGFSFDKDLPVILVTNLGTNPGLIENELDKITLYLKATRQTNISKDFVYSMINVDKDFNAFELSNSLAKHEVYRSHLIIDRLTQNPKINPPVMVLGALFRLFHSIALVHRFQLRDPNSIKHQLGVNFFQAQDYLNGSRHYHVQRTYRNIRLIKDADLAVKGQIPTKMGADHILKTLVMKLLA